MKAKQRVQRRGGLGRIAADGIGMSQYAVAKALGISRTRVKQIEANALRKLKAALK